jgi:hypothetical protein
VSLKTGAYVAAVASAGEEFADNGDPDGAVVGVETGTGTIGKGRTG